MKKLVVISIMAAMLLSVVGAAMASETDWLVLMRASTTAYTNAGANLQLCSIGTSVNGKDAADAKAITTGSTAAYIASYQPTFPDVPALYGTDKIGLINANNPSYSWNLRLWANPSYPTAQTTVRLGIWTVSSKALPASFAGTPYKYTLDVLDAAGVNVVSSKEWTDGIAFGTSTAPSFFMDFTTFPVLSASEAVDGGIKLRFTVAPVPEPSSMMALASGLVGMAGFAIRRRRA